LNFNNGTYNLNTGKLRPHSPEDYFLYKIPWNYNVKSRFESSKIAKYFEQTLKPEYITFSQELFGYCLYYSYRYHGLFYLFGTGGNGKSVWTRLFGALLGNDNVSNKDTGTIAVDKFAAARLYGKLANLCGELNEDQLKKTDKLKSLTSGDRIEGEFKHKDPFSFENKAKIISSCNKIPYSTDKTDGWYERQYVLPFLKKFRNSKQEDIDLLDKLITQREMEGLLKWAVQGLQRLTKNKKFSYPWPKKERYLMYQQNVKYFLYTFYAVSGNYTDTIPVKEIRDHYAEWCEKNDIPQASDQALGTEITYFTKVKPSRDMRTYIKRVKE